MEAYREKRKVKRSIIQEQKKVNEQFGNLSEDVNENRKLRGEGVLQQNKGSKWEDEAREIWKEYFGDV